MDVTPTTAEQRQTQLIRFKCTINEEDLMSRKALRPGKWSVGSKENFVQSSSFYCTILC